MADAAHDADRLRQVIANKDAVAAPQNNRRGLKNTLSTFTLRLAPPNRMLLLKA
jgi:hypothetical protein